MWQRKIINFILPVPVGNIPGRGYLNYWSDLLNSSNTVGDRHTEMRFIKSIHLVKDKKGKDTPNPDWTIQIKKNNPIEVERARDNLITLFKNPDNPSKSHLSYTLLKTNNDGKTLEVAVNLLEMPAHYDAVLELQFCVAGNNGIVSFFQYRTTILTLIL